MNASLANPPIGGTVGLIRSLIPSLVPSEQRVALECVEHPEEVALLSVADLASRTDTSPATVIRACQKLGFRGFQHLRLLLLRDLGDSRRDEAPAERAAGSRGRVPAVFDAARRELGEALGALDYDQFDAAAAAIASARRVLIVGNGGSSPAGQILALRFIASGRPCEAPLDAVLQQLSARTLAPTDVCIAVSDSGMNSVTLRAVEAAQAAGTTIVGVTSYARSRLSELASHTLVAGAAFHAWGEGAVSGNITQILLLAALQEAVAELGADPNAVEAVLDEVFEIVDEGGSDS